VRIGSAVTGDSGFGLGRILVVLARWARFGCLRDL
jgi:hypothetical protein